MMFWVALILLLAGGYWALRRMGTVANPVTFFSFGLAAPLFARAIFDFLEFDWNEIVGLKVITPVAFQNYETVVVIVLGGWVAFCLPWVLMPPNRLIEYSLPELDKQTSVITTILTASILLMLIIYASSELGYLPIWQMLNGILDVQVNDISLFNLPMGIMAVIVALTIVLTLDALHNLMSQRLKLTLIYKIAAISLLFFFSIWNGKRQLMLFAIYVYVVGYIYRWDKIQNFRNNRYSPYFLLPSMFLVLVVGFVLIDQIRYAENSTRPLSLLAYFSWPASNLLSISENIGYGNYRDHPFDALPFVLTELLPSRFGGGDNIVHIRPLLHEPTSPSGFFCLLVA